MDSWTWPLMNPMLKHSETSLTTETCHQYVSMMYTYCSCTKHPTASWIYNHSEDGGDSIEGEAGACISSSNSGSGSDSTPPLTYKSLDLGVTGGLALGNLLLLGALVLCDISFSSVSVSSSSSWIYSSAWLITFASSFSLLPEHALHSRKHSMIHGPHSRL